MGACNEKHMEKFSHLELEVEGLDLSDLDMGEYEGPDEPSSTMNSYTVSLSIVEGVMNNKLASVLGSFPGASAQKARLFYLPAVFYLPAAGRTTARSFRERAQQRLGADLAEVLKGTVPANATRQTAAPV